MEKRVSEVAAIEELCDIVKSGKPSEMIYNLGEGGQRKEVLMTHTGAGMTVRTSSSPLVRLYEDCGKTLMDVTDSNRNADGYSVKGLEPVGAYTEQSEHPEDLPTGVVELRDGNKFVFAPYFRQE